MKKRFDSTDIEASLATVLLAIMVVAASLGVIWRYVLKDPLAWSEELTRFCFIWFSYLTTSYVILNGGHIAMHIIEGFFKNPKSKLLYGINIIENVISIAFCGYFSYYAFLFMQKAHRTGELSSGMHFPTWIVYASVPVCFVIMCIRYAQKMIRDHKRWQNL